MGKIRIFILICQYGSLPEAVIALIVALISLFPALCGQNMIAIMLLLLSAGIELVIVMTRRHDSVYFSCSQSFLFPKRILLYQYIDKKKLKHSKNDCPKKLFVYSMKTMLNLLEANKLYTCYTHEIIAKIINRHCNVILQCEGQEQNLKRFSKKIMTDKCYTCDEKALCNIGKNRKTMFYALVFEKKDRLSK